MTKEIFEAISMADGSYIDCHSTLTKTIIDLCKGTGLESGIEVKLNDTMLLNSTKYLGNQRKDKFRVNSCLCDGILWEEDKDDFVIKYQGNYVTTSNDLTIDNLVLLYDAMVEIIKTINKK